MCEVLSGAGAVRRCKKAAAIAENKQRTTTKTKLKML
jgi:hypothetical protein